MSKRKKKLVCVGWGIWRYRKDPKRRYLITKPRTWKTPPWDEQWKTRQKAIQWFNEAFIPKSYKSVSRDNSIAKKLWVEVKHGD